MDRSLQRPSVPKVLLLDLDGVLGDIRVLLSIAVALVEEFGGNLSAEVFTKDLSSGRVACLWHYVADCLASQRIYVSWETVREMEATLYFGRNGADGLMHQEGLLIPLEMLEEWRRHTALGIVTNRPRDRTEAFLWVTGLSKHSLFSVIVTRDDVGQERIKPDRRPVELALERLGRGAGDDVVFADDSPSGMEAGRDLAFTVGIADPEFRDPATLKRAGARLVLPHSTQLQQLVMP